jgi:hypothetical protein
MDHFFGEYLIVGIIAKDVTKLRTAQNMKN